LRRDRTTQPQHSFPTRRSSDLNHGEITQGGSTITQQLARNVFLNFETTYSRKIQEMFIAVALEQKYTKEQILEFYLNNVNFSNGDRKSTRLNSSHVSISYAVFC